MKLRIVTWNIAAARKMLSATRFDYDHNEDLRYFADQIKKLSPDVVCLQESHRNAHDSLAKRMAALLDMQHVAETDGCPSHIDKNYRITTAVLATLPFKKAANWVLPYPNFELKFTHNNKVVSPYDRYVQCIDFGGFSIATMHPEPLGAFGQSYEFGPGRKLSKGIDALLLEKLNKPLIFAADFNMERPLDVLPQIAQKFDLQEALGDAPTKPHGGHPDHILYSAELRVNNSGVVATESDHYLCWAELEIMPKHKHSGAYNLPMSKTIIIEATEAFNPERRGIGVQMRSWLEAAPFNEFSDYKFVITHRQLDAIDELHVSGRNVRIQPVPASTEAAYIDQLYDYQPQVIFFPLALPKYVRQGLTKCVAVNYGMEDFYCRNYIAPQDIADSLRAHENALQNFAGIVTVSETSQHDLAWFFPECKDKITVVYPGIVKPSFASKAATIPQELKDAQYFLVVGYEQKKNIKRIATAFNDFKSQTGSLSKLVIVGKPGYGADEIDKYIATLRHQQDIVQLGYVSEPQKQQLLEGCHALVALPIYEGFGISALEGLAADKIVLVSDNGSLKEVVGNAGYLADPFSVESMKRQFAQISELHENPKRNYIAKRLETFDQTVQSRKLLECLAKFA